MDRESHASNRRGSSSEFYLNLRFICKVHQIGAYNSINVPTYIRTKECQEFLPTH